jgi:hypothetical protein
MKTSILTGERYFGVEVTSDGRLVVAERAQGRAVLTTEFPAGRTGAQALREHIEHQSAHPHVCIKACGAAALGVATALIPTPGIEVTLVSAHAIPGASAGSQPIERAERLAKLAERLF